ncbi:MAG TPA: glycosyltransferase family 4 protein [Patescibacteria group bacterium]|nr:glycosyltransferase family 4 protein [Patescibacteria group bacterium]
MKILVLNWRDPWHPLAGGAEIMVHEHVKYWQKQGTEVIWFTSSYKGARSNEQRANINFIRRGSQYTVYWHFFWDYLTGQIPDFDVVIDCFHFIPFFTPLYIHHKRIIAIIHEVAGPVWFSNIFLPIAAIGYMIEPLFFRIYRNIPFISVSESTKSELIKLGIQSKNISVIHNGISLVDLQSKYKKTRFPSFMFLGRVSKDKGIEDILKAFKQIHLAIPNGELWIAGKEEKQGYLTNLLKSYAFDAKFIKYLGFVDENKKFELLQQAWLLLHSSDKEGWGLTVIEAASQGTPTIGYNVPGLRDSIQDKITGLLVEKSPDKMAKTVIKLIQNEDQLENLRKNTREYARQFTWNKSGSESWKLLNSIF